MWVQPASPTLTRPATTVTLSLSRIVCTAHCDPSCRIISQRGGRRGTERADGYNVTFTPAK